MIYNHVYSPNVGLTSRASFEPSLARVSPEPSLALLAAILKIRNPSRTRDDGDDSAASRAVVFGGDAVGGGATRHGLVPLRLDRFPDLPRGARRSPPTLSTTANATPRHLRNRSATPAYPQLFARVPRVTRAISTSTEVEVRARAASKSKFLARARSRRRAPRARRPRRSRHAAATLRRLGAAMCCGDDDSGSSRASTRRAPMPGFESPPRLPRARVCGCDGATARGVRTASRAGERNRRGTLRLEISPRR